ncbi:MAG: hypothetical protein ACOVO1_09480 [Chitinophagaceae bacterium]
MIRKTTLLITAKLLLFCGAAMAQNTTANDSSLMYVNGEGLYINIGKTEKTKFNLLSTVQTGFQYNRFDSANTNSKTNRLSLNLARLSFNVTGLKDKMSLGIVTDFTSTTPILEGWLGFSMWNKKAKLTVGQRQTNTNNRLAMADERYAQVMGQTQAGKSNDGSVYGGLMQTFVGSSREGGVFFETNFSVKKWRFYPSVSITTGEGQNFFAVQPNVGFKYGGRIDIMPLGDFIKNNAFIAQDIYRERKPKLAFGLAASYNSKVSSPIGSDNATITGIYDKTGTADFADYRKLVADIIFKYQGFAFVGEYIAGTVAGKELYTNIGATKKLTNDVASAYYNIGSAVNIQSSYVCKNGWAVDGRFSTITPEFNLSNSLVRQQQWYTLGINKFIKNNAVKIGINTTYIDENTPTISTKRWVGNLAVQILL